MNRLNKYIMACVLGTALEWYDFALFGTLAVTIAKVLFQGLSEPHGDYLVFAAFASGFVMRPLGALYFGQLGDRHGRKKALTLTIILMAVSTTLIGLMPSAEMIGIVAPILIVVLRLLQGFSASGEYPAAMTWIAEMAPAEKRGFYASFSMVGVSLGIILGSLMTTVMTLSLSPEAFDRWGWRFLFILSAPLGFLGLWLRLHMQESPVFQHLRVAQTLARKPVVTVLHEAPWRLLKLFCLFTYSTVTFYIVYVYLTAYLVKSAVISLGTISLLNAGSMLLMAMLIPFFGKLSDQGNRERIMRRGMLASLVLAYPLFWSATHGHLLWLALILYLFAISMAVAIGPGSAYAAENFLPSIRNSGLALALNLPSSLLGGTAPLICAYLVTHFNTPIAPVFYFVIVVLLGLISVIT